MVPRAPRHFLDLDGIDAATLRRIVDMGHAMKRAGKRVPDELRPGGIADAVLMLIFEKPSTRTRVSFDVAMRQLGGQTLALNHTDLQIGRGEPISDTAKVLSRYVDAIMIRANKHATLVELAEHATVPVINGLTDQSHPCQIMADLLTLEEKKGDLRALTVAWCGDSCNVTNSWIHAAGKFGFALRIASPELLQPSAALGRWAHANKADLMITTDPAAAVKNADCVIADTWVSMNVTDSANRHNLLKPYQVDAGLMKLAKPDAIFMHCLPAHRGEEVTADVIDGPQSVVFDEAENRLHVQKSILAFCLDDGR
jgi:ornithine carbamoyltransferase